MLKQNKRKQKFKTSINVLYALIEDLLKEQSMIKNFQHQIFFPTTLTA